MAVLGISNGALKADPSQPAVKLAFQIKFNLFRIGLYNRTGGFKTLELLFFSTFFF